MTHPGSLRLGASALLLVALPAVAGAQEGGLPAPPDARAPAPPAVDAVAPLRGHVDWQGDPAMHVPWPVFRRGLSEALPRRPLTWRHMLRQTLYAPYLRASGIRVVFAAAMAAERACTPRQARRLVLEQLEYVEAFVAENPDDFALAGTPAEARRLLRTTGKIVVVHAIEGASRLLEDPAADARFWAERGVALVTLVRLVDDEHGGAAINRGLVGSLVNARGAWRRAFGLRRGLTERGRAAVLALAREGILVDMSHMTRAALDDALDVCRAHGIPPVVTHGMFRPVQDSARGFTAAQVLEGPRVEALKGGSPPWRRRTPTRPGSVGARSATASRSSWSSSPARSRAASGASPGTWPRRTRPSRRPRRSSFPSALLALSAELLGRRSVLGSCDHLGRVTISEV